MPVVYRNGYDELQVTLRADRELGLLDVDYVEDYNGIDGALSIRDTATGTRYSILMAEDDAVTPLVPHDAFVGDIAMATLPDGDFELEGRVRDTLGNYVIVGAYFDPLGTEDIVTATFSIVAGMLVYPLAPSVRIAERLRHSVAFQDRLTPRVRIGRL